MQRAGLLLVEKVCRKRATVAQLQELLDGDEGPLLRASVNVLVVNWGGWTGPVLWHAARTNGVSSEVITFLVEECGAEVDGRGEDGWTPLMQVALHDDEQADVEVAGGEFNDE